MTNARVTLVAANSPEAVAPPPGAALIPFDLDQMYVQVGGSVNAIRAEIDEACKDMATFYNREPDEVMRLISGHSARLSELRIKIQRIEDYHRIWKNVRTREIEPALSELATQFQLASRLVTVRELDWKMETGQR